MILQTLVQHYEDLAARGEAERPGWETARVSFALELNDRGAVIGLVPTTEQQGDALRPCRMSVPLRQRRTVGIAPYFLCDHSGYLLGIDSKSDPDRSAKCFAASRALHRSLLTGTDSPAGKAILAFFRTWDPHRAAVHPVLRAHLAEVISGGRLVFLYRGIYAHEDEQLRSVWQRHYDRSEGSPEGVCLVTGKFGPIALRHPPIRGIPNTPPSGVSLLSYCESALGSPQGQSVPIGTYAAYACASALNHLLADKEHCRQVGDTLVLFWAAGGEAVYQDAFAAVCFGGDAPAELPEPERDFYVLGLATNTGRFSVRFFLRDSFGGFCGKRDELLKTILTGTPYPKEVSTQPE